MHSFILSRHRPPLQLAVLVTHSPLSLSLSSFQDLKSSERSSTWIVRTQVAFNTTATANLSSSTHKNSKTTTTTTTTATTMSGNAGNSKLYGALASSGASSNATPGSNRAQWNAMDLHIGRGGRHPSQQQQGGGRYNALAARGNSGAINPAGAIPVAGTGSSSMRVDDTGLSARNILIRRKLMEKKRFDSADYAMSKEKEESGAASEAMMDVSIQSGAIEQQAQNPATMQQARSTINSCPATGSAAPFSPAQVGASAFFSALGADDADENMNKTAAVTKQATAPSSRYTLQQAPAAAARGAASRYGGVDGPSGGALSARNILIQKKLREKKHFDSADYQLARLKTASPAASPPSSTDETSSADRDDPEENSVSPMEIDPTPAAHPVESINSPSAASVALRSRMNAQMSPSVRGGKYAGLSGANELLRRKLSEKKRFDSADYHMEAGPVASKANQQHPFDADAAVAGMKARDGSQNFFVPAERAAKNAVTPPPVPQTIAIVNEPDYRKLSAANVLIRKKLKERKRFDSADYAMAKQGQQQQEGGDSSNDQGGSAGSLRSGHVVMNTPMKHNESISHQVKHIKLSEQRGGWAARVPTSNAFPGSSNATMTSTPLPKSTANTSSKLQDNRLVARNIIIQRKLSERKRFDSADYFKEAASRG